MNFNKFFFYYFILVSFYQIHSETPMHRSENVWGITSHLGLDNSIPFVGIGKEYSNYSIDNSNNNVGINIFYNPIVNHTIGIRIEENSDMSRLRQYNYGILDVGYFVGSLNYSRPNVEIFYRYYLLDSSFYISPILGVSSPSQTNYIRFFELDFRYDEFTRDYFSPYAMEYRVSSRVYGGIDIGYGFTIFDHLFVNFGWMVKVASNPKIRSRYNLDFVVYSFIADDLKIENAIYSQFLLQNINRDMTDARIGSSSFYIEAGIVF